HYALIKTSLLSVLRASAVKPPRICAARANLEILHRAAAPEQFLTRYVKSETICHALGRNRAAKEETVMLRKIYFFILFFAAVIFGPATVHSQSASLIAAGKKEGKAVVYGSLESDSADKAFSTFKSKT